MENGEGGKNKNISLLSKKNHSRSFKILQGPMLKIRSGLFRFFYAYLFQSTDIVTRTKTNQNVFLDGIYS